MQMRIFFILQASSPAVCDCMTHCLQPSSWCMPFNATLLFRTVKQCQLTKLLCIEMWFLNIKQTNKKNQKNKTKPKKACPRALLQVLTPSYTGMLLLSILAHSNLWKWWSLHSAYRPRKYSWGWASSRMLVFKAKG